MPASVGTVVDGHLTKGARMRAAAGDLVLARPGDPTHFGTPALVSAITHAAKSVERRYPGAAPLRVGDVSSSSGGAHPRHRSHRSGRDVDVLFYVVDERGQSAPASGFVAFDRFGVGKNRAPAAPDGTRPSARYFDDARNWHFVRTLLADPDARVQWIFCSLGVKARLLEYAATHERDPEVLFRAAWVVHQPSNGRPHDDHFHIRVACSLEELASGCIDTAPFWTWYPDMTKPKDLDDPSRGAATDAALIEALMVDYAD